MKINVYLAMAILLVVFGILTGVATAIKSVDTTGMPDYLLFIYNGAVYIILTSAAAPLFVFIRNIYGFLTNKYGEDPALQYEGKKLLETWLTYEAYIKGVSIMVLAFCVGTPVEPYAYYIGGAVAFIIDLGRKSISSIAG